MSTHFNRPPGWPQPPAGWQPSAEWSPDPGWPTPPRGWRLWVADTVTTGAVPKWPEPPTTASRPAPTAPSATSRPALTAPSTASRPALTDPSVTSLLFGIGGQANPPIPPSRSSARVLGWSAFGLTLLAITGVTVASLAAWPSAPITASASTTSTAAASGDAIEQAIARAEAGTALAVLADLNVRQRGPSSGYARSRFGSALRDTDGNGCDQRNDVLRRDLTQTTLKAGTNGCMVMAGTLNDPYTGRKIAFTRTTNGHPPVWIDHIVPLGDAWMKGARTWSAAKRSQFATDPLNLQAVGASVTTGKRGSDATRWLPEAMDYRCTYVTRQIAVKRKYGIWVSPTERTTIARILLGCSSQKLPRTRG